MADDGMYLDEQILAGTDHVLALETSRTHDRWAFRVVCVCGWMGNLHSSPGMAWGEGATGTKGHAGVTSG